MFEGSVQVRLVAGDVVISDREFRSQSVHPVVLVKAMFLELDNLLVDLMRDCKGKFNEIDIALRLDPHMGAPRWKSAFKTLRSEQQGVLDILDKEDERNGNGQRELPW